MTDIRMQKIERRFGTIRAVDGVSLDFPAGSFTAQMRYGFIGGRRCIFVWPQHR